jgi:hypothetical protein
MYDWKQELEGYFESRANDKFDDGVAAAKLNREIEDFLVETVIPALDGLKKSLAEKGRTLYIDKEKQSVRAAVRFGDTAEFVYEVRARHAGVKALAVKHIDGRESIIEPAASKNDNSIASLTMDDIRSSFVFEYLAAMGM